MKHISMDLLQQYRMDDMPGRESLETGFRRFRECFFKKGTIPFADGDSSVGMEYELQVAVEGNYKDVDLPIVIRESSYFKNIVKRTGRGDLPESCLKKHQDLLFKNKSNIWENSWVRLRPGFSLWIRERCWGVICFVINQILCPRSVPISRDSTVIIRGKSCFGFLSVIC